MSRTSVNAEMSRQQPDCAHSSLKTDFINEYGKYEFSMLMKPNLFCALQA